MKREKAFVLSFLLVFKFYFKTDHVAQVSLKLANIAKDSILILVPPLLAWWNYRCILLCLVYVVLGVKPVFEISGKETTEMMAV